MSHSYFKQLYCLLTGALELFKTEKKEPAQKLLSRFLDKYEETELLELLHQLVRIQHELQFYENCYFYPESFEEGGENYFNLCYHQQNEDMKAVLYEDEFPQNPDPWS